jgi:hypothetical protein
MLITSFTFSETQNQWAMDIGRNHSSRKSMGEINFIKPSIEEMEVKLFRGYPSEIIPKTTWFKKYGQCTPDGVTRRAASPLGLALNHGLNVVGRSPSLQY